MQNPIIATALALRALIDETNAAAYSKSISNVPVPGMTGIVTVIDAVDLINQGNDIVIHCCLEDVKR